MIGIHNVVVTAKIIPLEDGRTILRLENSSLQKNGPDVHLYLSTDKLPEVLLILTG
jgi:hypothetical protein